MRPRRVLCVTNMYPLPERPVAGVFVERQVAALRSLGHIVDVHLVRGWRSRRAYLEAFLGVARRSRRAYDVVHAHYGLTGLASVFSGPPLVVTLHGSDALVGRLEPFLSRLGCRRAAAVIAVSSAIAERVRHVGPPVHVVPCGVDTDRFRPLPRADARRRLGLEPARTYVLFPFDPARRVKRADLARAAISRLASESRSVELLEAGTVPHDEMPYLYAAADAMLLCSDSEGSPTSIKESLACDRPVVAVDVGGVREILDGVPGCAVTARDPDAIAGALARVLDRDAPFEGRRHAERYDELRIARRVSDVYEAAIASSHRGDPAEHPPPVSPG